MPFSAFKNEFFHNLAFNAHLYALIKKDYFVGFWYLPIKSIQDSVIFNSWISDDLADYLQLNDKNNPTKIFIENLSTADKQRIIDACNDYLINDQQFNKPIEYAINLSDGTKTTFKCKFARSLDIDGNPNGVCVFHHSHEVGDSYDNTYKSLNKLLNETTTIARVGGWEIDLANGNQPVWSKITREIHEVPEDYIPNMNEAINFYKEGYDRDLVQRVVAEAIEKGGSWDIECRLITYKKREIWVRAIGRTEMEGGKCVRLYGVFQDIDRIKRSELEKIAISERLSFATSSAKVGIWELDLSTNKLDWDDRMFELYQIDKATFDHSYANWAKSLTAEDRLRSETMFKNALEGKEDFDLTFSIKWPDQSIRFIRGIANVVRDDNGNAQRILGTNWDVTDEEKLKRDLHYNKSILEESSATALLGGWDYDVSTKHLFWSDMMKVIHEVPSSYVPTFANSIRFFKVEHQNELREAIKKAYYKGKGWDLELIITTAKGTKKWIRCTGKAERIHGKTNRVFGTFQDISKMKKVQKSLIEATNDAIEANKSKSMFLANMSHEIRTPLNGVIGFMELLSQTQLTTAQIDILKNANTSANNLLLIINDILDLSKIEAGKLELDPVKFNLHAVIYSIVNSFNFIAGKKGIELLLDLNVDVPTTVLADELRLTQILYNLLSNAVKFTSEGFIRLAISSKATSKPNYEIFTFTVEDTGIGINPVQQKKLFQAFTQADSTTTRKYGGTGLGLTISNMILAQMGSNLVLKSEAGKGSIFSFSIELKCDESEIEQPKTIDHIKRVLVVDDVLHNCTIAKNLLTSWGILVETATSAQQAMGIIAKNKAFDLLITDYKMPLVNGLAFVKEIRERLHLTADKLPVILMHSSADDSSIINESKDLGIRFKLTKPINPEELFDRISRIHTQSVEETKEILFQDPKNKVLSTTLYPKILIAEDVDLNRILIKALIKRYLPNAIIFEAVDGVETVEKFIALRPDLIFMDIQMPKQDGYISTSEIRRIASEFEQNTVKIVALTAIAINVDKGKMQQIGLDDYITKPLIPLELRRVLKEQLAIAEADDATTSSLQQSQYDETNFISVDRSIFDVAEMKERFLDDQELITQMFNQVWLSLEDVYSQILRSEAQQNWSNVRDRAHKMKGLSQNFSFKNLSKIAESVENSTQDEDLSDLILLLKDAYNDLILHKQQIEHLAV